MRGPLGLPVLGDEYTVLVSACGRLATGSTSALAKLAEFRGNERTARHGEGEAAEFVRVLSGEDEGRCHLHIDVAKRQQFATPPSTNAEEAEIAEWLKQFWGEQVEARLVGRFIVPLAVLPERGFLRSMMFAVEIAGTKVQQIGSTFSFSGGPVRRLHWNLDESDARVSISLTVMASLTIDSEYLSKAYHTVHRAFDTAVLGDTHESDSKSM